MMELTYFYRVFNKLSLSLTFWYEFGGEESNWIKYLDNFIVFGERIILNNCLKGIFMLA